MVYRAPITEQLFALETSSRLAELSSLPAFEGIDAQLTRGVLEESAKLAEQLFYPINQSGDRQGARWSDGEVRLADGFRDAYAAWAAGGWNGIEAPVSIGGQGFPLAVSAAIQEQIFGANVAFSQIVSLTLSAIRAIDAHASDDIKSLYLPKLVSGEWTATMDITEPGAGSDVGAISTSARRVDDGTYRIKGSKMFITFGEHDASANIIHLVLARIVGAPAGTRGLSLFLVPKLLLDTDGMPGLRNDIICTAIEHKLGMRGSATAALSYGDENQCVGFLIGEPQGGMRTMFTMMNHARIGVGLQGVGLADVAYQKSVGYAVERVQSKGLGGQAGPVRIIEHPDVRRTLMRQRALIQAARALAYYNAAMVDIGEAGSVDDDRTEFARLRANLLTPMTKSFCTDIACEVTGSTIQIFGGMGFIEETGVAQHYRDARILPIYEGTNGIQALDLIGRKLKADGGTACHALLSEMDEEAHTWVSDLPGVINAQPLERALAAVQRASDRMLSESLFEAAGTATPFLRMISLVTAGWLLGRQASVAVTRLSTDTEDVTFLKAKIETANFFLEQILPEVFALDEVVNCGSNSLFALSEAQFAS